MSETASGHTRRRTATRDAILEAALAMAGEPPAGPVSHEAIATRTGIAPRTIYRHFPTRADLTGALWLRLREAAGIQWPSTEAGIGPAVVSLFEQFETHSSLVRASIAAAAATDHPVHGSAEGRAAFEQSLKVLRAQLPARTGRQVVAACVAIYSAPFWQMLRDRGQLSNQAAAETAAWVLDAVIVAARRSATPSRRITTRRKQTKS